MILTKDPYDKLMQDIQKRIDETDRLMKESAEAMLQKVYYGYKKRLMDKLEYEMQRVDLAEIQGNESTLKHCQTLAGIYKSILDIDTGNARLIIAAIAITSMMLHVGIPPKLSVFPMASQPIVRMNS